MKAAFGKIAAILSLIVLSAVFILRFNNMQIVVPKDESLPYFLYFSRPIKQVERGMIATFWHHQSKRLLGKKIVGFPGDVVAIQHGHIFVAGNDFGEIKQKSKSGRTYHAIKPCTIPEGLCFVYGTHEFSFDSRYEEMGLITIEELQRELWPIF